MVTDTIALYEKNSAGVVACVDMTRPKPNPRVPAIIAEKQGCKSMKRLSRAAVVVVAISGFCSFANAQADVEEAFDKAATQLTDLEYTLQYKFKPGDSLTYKVEQLATVDTTIDGNNQKTQLRSGSIRTLRVTDVNADGQMTFEHVIDEVDMWSEVTGRQAVSYNSATDEEAPEEFANIKEVIGTPISLITIAADGTVVKREDKTQQPNLGMGGLSLPLPKQAVGVGFKWSMPFEIKVRMDNQQVKTVKTREQYTLEKVSAGVATIKVETQILTPVTDAKIRSQLIQRLSAGTIRFDIDAGRLISKQLDWDENVLGFSGPESNMKYLARFTEQLLDEEKVKEIANARKESQRN
jgi:hypothetical protein